MKQTVRTLALISALTLSAAPALQAEVMGTNPRPYAVATPISWVNVALTVLSTYAH